MRMSLDDKDKSAEPVLTLIERAQMPQTLLACKMPTDQDRFDACRQGAGEPFSWMKDI
jgi:hypothetical protein